MQPNLESSFISYHLSESELESGMIFSFEQLARLQNEVSICAEQRLMMLIPPEQSAYFAYALGAAALDAKIELLKWLIDCSKIAETEAKNRASNQSA